MTRKLTLLCTCLLLAQPALAASHAKPKKPAKPAAAAVAKPAPVGGNLSIVATVNDEAISSLDVEKRLQMVLATTGISDTPESRERLRPQLLRVLIDERLQAQEAQRGGIQVSPEDVTQAVNVIEQQRGMPPGALEATIKAGGADTETFYSQLKAQIAWNKLVMKTLRPQIKVSEDEIDRSRGRIDHHETVSEVRIAILALSVDKPEREAAVKKLADKLAGEIRAGASFEKIAPQVTSGSITVQLVEPFWISPAQLDPAVLAALKTTPPGSITSPQRTPEGYSIIKMYDLKRQAKDETDDSLELHVKDILLKLKPTATGKDAGLLLDIAKQLASHPGTCEAKGIGGVENTADMDMEVNFRDLPANQLPEGVSQLIAPLKMGEISEPVATEEGIRMFMLCGRNRMPLAVAEREKLYNLLFQEKLMLEAQKKLRNLRRDAFIDIRV